MQTVENKTKSSDSISVSSLPSLDDIKKMIADYPEDLNERAKMLNEIHKQFKVIKAQLNGIVSFVRAEFIKVVRDSMLQKMHPAKIVLAEILNRYELSAKFGVTKEDLDIAINEISINEKVLAQLSHLKAIGAEMTITSVTDGEIVFTDTVDNVNVESQEKFLSGLDEKARSDAVSTLAQRFPEIGRLLQRTDSDSGVNYNEYLLICEVIGAEPMPEADYSKLQSRKSVDRKTICWLFTKQKMLDRCVALRGDRNFHGVEVYECNADNRYRLRAGRPLLRVERDV